MATPCEAAEGATWPEYLKERLVRFARLVLSHGSATLSEDAMDGMNQVGAGLMFAYFERAPP